MAENVRQFDYHYVIIDDELATMAGVVKGLCESGVNLLAFSSTPHGGGSMQLDLVSDDAGKLVRVLDGMGLSVSPRKSGFLIRGEGGPCALSDALERLGHDVHITSVQAVSSDAWLWVKVDEQVLDVVDEASEESFPASDSPAWTVSGRAG